MLQSECDDRGEYAFYEPAAVFAVGTEADLARHDGMANSALAPVVALSYFT